MATNHFGPHRWLNWLTRMIVAFIASALALILGEGLVRLLGRAPEIKPIGLASDECIYQRSRNPILGFEFKANYRCDEPDFVQSYERTNAHGLRDKERSLDKPTGVKRVLLLGDSVVEGYKLREHETISRQWEALAADEQLDVLNFGVSAYCTRAEVELLEVKGLQFDPDIVVLVFVENDFDNFNREAFPLGETIDRPAIVNALFRRSHLFRLASLHGNLFHFRADTDPVGWNHESIGDNNVPNGLKRFKELADQTGFQPLIAIWPRFLDDQIVDVCPIREGEDELVIERLAKIQSIPSVRLSDFFKRHCDSTQGRNPRLLYTTGDKLHPSALGCRVAAMALRQILRDVETGIIAADSLHQTASPLDAAAIQAARRMGQAEPTYTRVYNHQGTELLKAGKLHDAVRYFEKALEEDPSNGGAHNNLGIAYERLGQGKAEYHFRQAVRLMPDFAPAHFNLGRTLLKQNKIAEGTAELEKTIEIDPNHVGALDKLGVQLGTRGDFSQARELLERAIRLDPNNAEVHNNLGVVCAAGGQLKQAANHFRETLRINPRHSRAKRNLSQIEAVLK